MRKLGCRHCREANEHTGVHPHYHVVAHYWGCQFKDVELPTLSLHVCTCPDYPQHVPPPSQSEEARRAFEAIADQFDEMSSMSSDEHGGSSSDDMDRERGDRLEGSISLADWKLALER